MRVNCSDRKGGLGFGSRTLNSLACFSNYCHKLRPSCSRNWEWLKLHRFSFQSRADERSKRTSNAKGSAIFIFSRIASLSRSLSLISLPRDSYRTRNNNKRCVRRLFYIFLSTSYLVKEQHHNLYVVGSETVNLSFWIGKKIQTSFVTYFHCLKHFLK